VLLQVLWELITHQIPFDGLNGAQVMWIVVERGTVSYTMSSSCCVCGLQSHVFDY